MENVSQDRLELALKASNEGIWDWILETDGPGELYYSDRNLEFLGVSEGNAPNIFLTPEPWLYEEDLAEFSEALEAVFEDGGDDLFAVDCRYERPDGRRIWLRVRGAAVRDEKGKLIRLAGSMIDISRRKKAESSLEEERHRLETLIENVPVNVYFKDVESRFVMANTATANKMGLSNVDDLLGKSDHDFFDARHADKSRSDEETIMVSGESQEEVLEQETWEEGRDDTWVITSKMPWRDRKGKIQGVFGVTHDVTNLVKTQRQLMDMTFQLKQKHEMMQEELQLAHEIQLSMIKEDQVTEFPAKDVKALIRAKFAYRYAPVTGLAGDFYQVIPLEDSKVGLFMCDVMGHGVRSALIVSMLRGLMEKERDSAASPEWFIYGLNQGLASILRRAGVTMFATAFYAVLDLKNKTIEYTNAGHPSPLVVTKDGVQHLSDFQKVVGPALGLIEECAYTPGKVEFDQLEKLILYTDGVYETEDANGEEMGMERLIETLKVKGHSIEEDLDRLLEATRNFAGDGEFGDDVCLLGIELSSGL